MVKKQNMEIIKGIKNLKISPSKPRSECRIGDANKPEAPKTLVTGFAESVCIRVFAQFLLLIGDKSLPLPPIPS